MRDREREIIQREDRNCSRKNGDGREGLYRDRTKIENEKNMQGGREIERELCREMTEILIEKNNDDRNINREIQRRQIEREICRE